LRRRAAVRDPVLRDTVLRDTVLRETVLRDPLPRDAVTPAAVAPGAVARDSARPGTGVAGPAATGCTTCCCTLGMPAASRPTAEGWVYVPDGKAASGSGRARPADAGGEVCPARAAENGYGRPLWSEPGAAAAWRRPASPRGPDAGTEGSGPEASPAAPRPDPRVLMPPRPEAGMVGSGPVESKLGRVPAGPDRLGLCERGPGPGTAGSGPEISGAGLGRGWRTPGPPAPGAPAFWPDGAGPAARLGGIAGGAVLGIGCGASGQADSARPEGMVRQVRPGLFDRVEPASDPLCRPESGAGRGSWAGPAAPR